MDLSFLRKNRAVSEIWIIIKNLDSKRGSNVNEVIRAVLNSLFFFYKKILHAQKAQKAQRHNQAKAQNANKQTSEFFFSLDVFYALLFLFACKRFLLLCL